MADLKKTIKEFQKVLCGDAPAKTRVRAANTLLNGGHDLSKLDEEDIGVVWESIFFALWYTEMGRGCEEIIAAVERACLTNYRLTRYGFQTIAAKWYGLDQYRVDKMSHLARHLLSVLLTHQIKLWLRTLKKKKKMGTKDIYCKELLKRTLLDVKNAFGLCYFLLEITADEIATTLTETYRSLNIVCGHMEFKANLLVFLHRQIISFMTDIKLDGRLLRTFDQYVIRKFVDELMPNEPQLAQILISLRLYQSLDKNIRKSKNAPSGKCKALLERWSSTLKDTHEKCINGEYFRELDLSLTQ